MDLGAEQQKERSEVDYYIDLNNSRSIIGRLAVADFIESGGHPSDLVPLEKALTGNYDFDRVQSISGWSKEECLAAGKWLCSIFEEKRQLPRKTINTDIINCASRLGLAPSEHQINHPARFGSTSAFYIELDQDAQIKYTEFAPNNAENYLLDLVLLHERMPTATEIKSYNSEDRSKPSYRALIARLSKTLPEITWELGLHQTTHMKYEDYIEWGVAYLEANHGNLPSQRAIGWASQIKRGPSERNVALMFDGALDGFNEIIQEKYALKMTALAATSEVKQQELLKLCGDSSMPMAIKSLIATQNQERLSIYCRYKILQDLHPSMCIEDLLRLSDPKTSSLEFMVSLKRADFKITAKDVSAIALSNGFDGSSWKMKSDKMQLNLTSILEQNLVEKRGKLTESDSCLMDDCIALGVDFYRANGFAPYNSHIQKLTSKRLLPKVNKFQYLFVSNELFRAMVTTRHDEYIKSQAESKMRLAQQMEQQFKDKQIPVQLFHSLHEFQKDSESSSEILKKHFHGEIAEDEPINIFFDPDALDEDIKLQRYAKFLILQELRPELEISQKIVLASIKRSRSFSREVTNVSSGPIISRDEVEVTASMLGIYEYVFPERIDEQIKRLTMRYNKPRKRKLSLHTTEEPVT